MESIATAGDAIAVLGWKNSGIRACMVPLPNLGHSDTSLRRENWATAIFTHFQPQYIYVTLSSHDDGVDGSNIWNRPFPRNLLIMSQGGKGHIPIPLWLKAERPSDYAIRDAYDYDFVFTGIDDEHWVRVVAYELMRTRLPDRWLFGETKFWKKAYRRSKFILAPRGRGRGSFRLTGIMQMGMVPVYLYEDIVWLPYYDSLHWSDFALILQWDSFNASLNTIRNTSVEKINQMRMRIHEVYESHFTVEAVFRHIFAFLRGGFVWSDLRSAPLIMNSG
jgi:hypothetical protein